MDGKSSSLQQKNEIIRQMTSGERLLKDVFMIPKIDGICGRCEYVSCIVTVTKMLDLAVLVNIHIPSVCKDVQVEVAKEEQRKVLSGRPIVSFAPGVPRKVAIISVVSCLSLNSFDATKRNARIDAKFTPKVNWLEAYTTFGTGRV